MTKNNAAGAMKNLIIALMLSTLIAPAVCRAADTLVGIHSARVMSQSMPWMAQEAGLFKKYNIDFNLVFISSSSIVTAALLGGDAEMTITGGIGNVAAYARGSTDVVFIGGVKNTMTQTLVAGGNIKRPEDLKGKKIGVSRIGGNSHYFTIQALRRYNMDASKDVQFIQTGGDPETLAAFISGSIDVANLTPPTDAQAIAKGYHYVIYGPDLKIPYAATAFVTKRSVIAKRPQVIDNFMIETKGLTGAQSMLRVLAKMGVEKIFASPGSEWSPVWEALAEPGVEGMNALRVRHRSEPVHRLSRVHGGL